MGEHPRRVVAVFGAFDPARVLAVQQMLEACAQTHGWGDRIRIEAVGVGAGAGRPREAEVAAAGRRGISLERAVCRDLTASPETLASASVVVAGSDEEADYVMQLDASTGKPILCLLDLLSSEEAQRALEEEPDFEQMLELLEPEVPELLRRLIAA